MGFKGLRSEVQSNRLDWAEGQTKNTCALAPSEGAHLEFGCAVRVLHLGILNPALFGTTHTCLVGIVVEHVSSHDVMGFEGLQIKVQSNRLDSKQMEYNSISFECLQIRAKALRLREFSI